MATGGGGLEEEGCVLDKPCSPTDPANKDTTPFTVWFAVIMVAAGVIVLATGAAFILTCSRRGVVGYRTVDDDSGAQMVGINTAEAPPSYHDTPSTGAITLP